jgi:hypothetical protein
MGELWQQPRNAHHDLKKQFNFSPTKMSEKKVAQSKTIISALDYDAACCLWGHCVLF